MQAVTIDRDKYIGGSDIPIIMGISPFKKRFDLLLEKAELKDNDFGGNEYTEYGNVLEPKIREYINSHYGCNFQENVYIEGDVRCHVDGIYGDTILEIKTTSQIHENVNDYKVYLVQLLFYMEYTKCEKGILAVYERTPDFDEKFNEEKLKIYRIDVKDYKNLLEGINKAVAQFRIDLAKIKENPMLTEEDLLPVDLNELSSKVIALENQLATFKEIEKKVKDFKAQLKTAMENNDIKKWETPNGVKITLIADGEDKEILKFNEDKFKEENEKIYNEYLETKIQKGKAGYVKITLPKNEV